ncbi:MAG: phosphatidylglycerophosphatase A [Acetobacteraceae bacterium]
MHLLPRHLSVRSLRGTARLVASGGGLGRAPLAPGTVASAATLLPGALLLHVSPALLPLAALAATLAGLWAIRAGSITDDPGWVVIDEVAGQLLALWGLAYVSPLGLLAAFVGFRVLDVVKPGPVGWADRQHGAAGIMGDDLIAGAIVAAILWAARSYWPLVFG